MEAAAEEVVIVKSARKGDCCQVIARGASPTTILNHKHIDVCVSQMNSWGLGVR